MLPTNGSNGSLPIENIARIEVNDDGTATVTAVANGTTTVSVTTLDGSEHFRHVYYYSRKYIGYPLIQK